MNLKSELSEVTEIPVGEPVQESEARDSLEALRSCRNAHGTHPMIESDGMNKHPNHVNGERSCLGTTEDE